MLNDEVARTERSTHEGEMIHMIGKYPATVVADKDYFTGKPLTSVLLGEGELTPAQAQELVQRRGDERLPGTSSEEQAAAAAAKPARPRAKNVAPSKASSSKKKTQEEEFEATLRESTAKMIGSPRTSSPKRQMPRHESAKNVSPTSEMEGVPGPSQPQTPITVQQQIAAVVQAQDKYMTQKVSLQKVNCHAPTHFQQEIYDPFQNFDKFLQEFRTTMESFQNQLSIMAALRPALGGSPPALTVAVHGMTPVEERLRSLFPINRLTPAMLKLLRHERVAEFVRMQLIQKLYGSYPDAKPDYEVVIKEFLDYMLSKRFQVSFQSLCKI